MFFGKFPATKASGYSTVVPNKSFGTAPGFGKGFGKPFGKGFGKFGKPWGFI